MSIIIYCGSRGQKTICLNASFCKGYESVLNTSIMKVIKHGIVITSSAHKEFETDFHYMRFSGTAGNIKK